MIADLIHQALIVMTNVWLYRTTNFCKFSKNDHAKMLLIVVFWMRRKVCEANEKSCFFSYQLSTIYDLILSFTYLFLIPKIYKKKWWLVTNISESINILRRCLLLEACSRLSTTFGRDIKSWKKYNKCKSFT